MRVAFDHVGLSVGDLEAAEAFYTTAFGFARQLAFDLSPHPIRGVMLTHPSGFRMELFEHEASAPGGARCTPRLRSTWPIRTRPRPGSKAPPSAAVGSTSSTTTPRRREW